MISARLAYLRRILPLVAGPLLFLCVACEQLPHEPPVTRLGVPFRTWWVATMTNAGVFDYLEFRDVNAPGVIDEVFEVGSMIIYPTGRGPLARAEVFSNATGETYWIGAQAPTRPDWPADSTYGVEVALLEGWRLRKERPDAKLQLRITGLHLEAMDDNAMLPGRDECPWASGAAADSVHLLCAEYMMVVRMLASYWLYPDTATRHPAWSAGEELTIRGYRGAFTSFRRLPNRTQEGLFYIFQLDFDEQPGHVQVRLAESPVIVDVPLDSIPVGGIFELHTITVGQAFTRRQRESYASTYFRDPVGMSGSTLDLTGITVLPPPPAVRRPEAPTEAAPPCGTDGAQGAGGTIAFAAASYRWPERPGEKAEITITRSGGSAGVASVLFSTLGGTASPGSDYEAVSEHVWFADGAEGTYVVHVPIVNDDAVEPGETVLLTLSSPGGCASIGRSSAELTIMDDDRPLTPTGRSIGGTVSGLEGSGLVLTNVSTDHLAIAANGPFAFGREYPDGHIYQVRVHTQPADPVQACTVMNGSGTVAGVDVTDIHVTCETLPPGDGGLDPSFGTAGQVTNEALGPIADVALQADGRIVAVGGDARTGARLARFNADGSLDTMFGDDGIVAITFHGASHDVLNAVAVQPDGRIVVAGYTRDGANSATYEDWVIARYHADGTVDTGFGTGGTIITDFHGRGDGAADVLLAEDGSIIVVGSASLFGTGVADSDFAVVRYTADGRLDTSFGTGGSTTVAIAGAADIPHAAALQADGRIVVVGRVATSGGADPDIGMIRLNADGSLDTAFGEAGVVRDRTGLWDEAVDVVVQPDGRIAVAGQAGSGVLLVARFNADGSRDAGFGTGGRAQEVGGIGRAIALQPDGRIVAAGWASAGTSSDFVIARFSDDGTADASFGTDGVLHADFFGGSDVARAVVVQPDGRIIVAGSAVNGSRTRAAMVRLLP